VLFRKRFIVFVRFPFSTVSPRSCMSEVLGIPFLPVSILPCLFLSPPVPVILLHVSLDNLPFDGFLSPKDAYVVGSRDYGDVVCRGALVTSCHRGDFKHRRPASYHWCAFNFLNPFLVATVFLFPLDCFSCLAWSRLL